jgi:hypothetical protein
MAHDMGESTLKRQFGRKVLPLQKINVTADVFGYPVLLVGIEKLPQIFGITPRRCEVTSCLVCGPGDERWHN